MKKTLLFTLLINVGVYAQAPVITSDLRGASYSPNKTLISMGSNIYFAANNGTQGSELWRSDGTDAGTVIVKDIAPTTESSSPQQLAKVGNTLFFCAYRSDIGQELWKTNGSEAGTVLVKDIAPSYNGSAPRNLTAFNNTLYFSANYGNELWKSDGTSAGTTLVKTLSGGANISNIIPVGNALYFTLILTTYAEQLWKTDGTEAGTILLKEFTSPTYSHITFNNNLVFCGNDGLTGVEIWKSNGTVAGTVLVNDLESGIYSASPSYLTVFNGSIYFSASNGLYKTDGTSVGTVFITPLDGYYLANVNGSLYFVDFTDGYNIYKSNGTAGGNTLLKKYAIYDNLSIGFRFIGTSDGKVYFNAKSVEYGEELWQTNGTPAGTILADDLRPGTFSGFPANTIVENGNTLFFTATNGAAGFELWRKPSGSSAQMVKDIEPNLFSSNPTNLTKVNNLLFFSATDNYLTHLFVINTVGSSIYSQGLPGSSPSDFLSFNNKLYLQTDQYGDRELYVADGSTVTMVKDIFPGLTSSVYNSSSPTGMTTVGSNFYFAATSDNDRELWKSDGTEVGTVLVKNINASNNSNPNHLIEFGGNLYFFATVGSTRLYKSDCTNAGTVLVQYAPSSEFYTVNPSADEIAKTSSTLYLTAYSNTYGIELFKLESNALTLVKDMRTGSFFGQPNGSNPSNLTPVGNRLFFTANDGINGTELWKTDGATASTVLVKDIQPGNVSSNVSNLINFNGTLYFSANSTANGQELWKSDGTEEGTVMIKDINVGNGSSDPGNFCVIGNTLYFSAYHPKFGVELWKTDGTAAGTMLVSDLYPDYDSESNDSSPNNLINVNGNLFFAANNGLSGNELFYFKPCPNTGSFNEYVRTPTYTLHAAQTIQAENEIMFGRDVSYIAGKSVTLNPGFTIKAQDDIATRGNVFRAEIRACN